MNIWIMRHGEAGFNAASDAERRLTAFGIESAVSQGSWLGQNLLARKIRLDKMLVSPYLRAQQTLEHLIEGMQAVEFCQNFANASETWEEITPGGNPHTVESYLQFLRNEGAENLLLVSHLPLVFDLTQLLTGRQSYVQFPPATIAEIHLLENGGSIVQVKSV